MVLPLSYLISRPNTSTNPCLCPLKVAMIAIPLIACCGRHPIRQKTHPDCLTAAQPSAIIVRTVVLLMSSPLSTSLITLTSELQWTICPLHPFSWKIFYPITTLYLFYLFKRLLKKSTRVVPEARPLEQTLQA